MGDWKVEEKMVMLHEKVWFHKAKILTIVSNLALFINYLQRKQTNFKFEVIRNQNPNLITQG